MTAPALNTSAGYGIGTRSGAYNKVEVDDGNFDYDERVMVEVSQKAGKQAWIRPIGGISNQEGPFNFVIEPMVDKYLYLNKTKLGIKMKMLRGDGTECRPWEDIAAPTNLVGTALWDTVEVLVNGQPFAGASCVNAGVKGYVETILSYDADARDSHLQSQFFYMDSPYQYDNMKVPVKLVEDHWYRAVQANEIPVQLPEAYLDEQVTENDLSADDRLKTQAEKLALINAEIDRRKQANAAAKVANDRHLATTFANTVLPMAEHMHAGGTENNFGFNDRWEVACHSHEFDVNVPITHDFFRVNNHIGPGNRIEVRLHRDNNRKLINTKMDKNYKLVITDLKMYLHLIERKERVPTPMTERYLMNETQLHRQVVPMGMSAYSFRLFNGGVMPKTVMMFMTPTAAADGRYQYNICNMHHYNIRHLALMINGEEHPTGGLDYDFSTPNALVSHGFNWVFENTGSDSSDRGNSISLRHFKGGSFLAPFDLTPDKCNGLHNHNAELGYIDLDITWRTPLMEPVTVWYMMVFNKVVINDKFTSQVMVLDIEA